MNPSDMEKQKINPPRMLRTDPAQPMNRAAPSSNLNPNRQNTGAGNRWWDRKLQEECYNGMLLLTSVSQIRGQKTLTLSGVRRENRRSKSRFLRRGWVYSYRTLILKSGNCKCFRKEETMTYRWHLPLRIKCSPHRQVILALVVSDPPILVHFMPTSARVAPKNPRHTAEIISPRHTWI